jgi:hypothetical protein
MYYAYLYALTYNMAHVNHGIWTTDFEILIFHEENKCIEREVCSMDYF